MKDAVGDTAGDTLLVGCTPCQKFPSEGLQPMGDPHWGRDTLERLWLWVTRAGAVTLQRHCGCGWLTLQWGHQRGPVAVGDPCQGRDNPQALQPMGNASYGRDSPNIWQLAGKSWRAGASPKERWLMEDPRLEQREARSSRRKEQEASTSRKEPLHTDPTSCAAHRLPKGVSGDLL